MPSRYQALEMFLSDLLKIELNPPITSVYIKLTHDTTTAGVSLRASSCVLDVRSLNTNSLDALADLYTALKSGFKSGYRYSFSGECQDDLLDLLRNLNRQLYGSKKAITFSVELSGQKQFYQIYDGTVSFNTSDGVAAALLGFKEKLQD